MNNYQRDNLKKLVSNYSYLIRNKNFKELYKKLQASPFGEACLDCFIGVCAKESVFIDC